MKNPRLPEIAFLISVVSVLGSLPASVPLEVPDLPGIGVVVTGGLASLLSIRRLHERRFQILVALVALTASIAVLHRRLHRMEVAHDWLEPLYVGAIVTYCGVAISLSGRLLRRDADSPPRHPQM